MPTSSLTREAKLVDSHVMRGREPAAHEQKQRGLENLMLGPSMMEMKVCNRAAAKLHER